MLRWIQGTSNEKKRKNEEKRQEKICFKQQVIWANNDKGKQTVSNSDYNEDNGTKMVKNMF